MIDEIKNNFKDEIPIYILNQYISTYVHGESTDCAASSTTADDNV